MNVFFALKGYKLFYFDLYGFDNSYTLSIGESPSICPFLKNNGPEGPQGPRVHYFSGMDRYEDFLLLKIHHIFKVCTLIIMRRLT